MEASRRLRAWLFWRNWTIVGILAAAGMILLAMWFAPQHAPEDQAALAEDDADETRVAKIDLDEDPAEEAIFKKIEGGFGVAVDALELVLFYSIGGHKQTYVQMDHVEHYVRPRGSNSDVPFVRHDPNGTYPADTITEKQAEALAAQDKLLLTRADREESDPLAKKPYIRRGEIGDRLIEFISVKIDTRSKYVFVKQDGLFKKELRPRKELSSDPEHRLKPDEVQRLATRGWLKIDEKKAKAGDSRPHLHTETVGGAPLVVLWLAAGAVIFTLYMRGFNIWGFGHAIQIVRGKYDNPQEAGEVTHFQALASALSATVGLGNIAGVTIAMTLGGPGAFFWMLFSGFFGMTSKFVECTLGQKYRRVKPDGTVLGGPMQYLYEGLKELKLAPLGLVLSLLFAVMCILASLGGGNMFQANQSGQLLLATVQKGDAARLGELNDEIKAAAAANDFDKMSALQKEKSELEAEMTSFGRIFQIGYGIALAIVVALVIIGGIKRIGKAAEKIVPSMCLIYAATCLYIIFSHLDRVPDLVAQIFTEAFNPQAISGGMVGVLVIGVQRAAFSNEAGTGSAAIAHSAAKTDEPVREGSVALLGPFIDTIIVCSMTALVILITGAWKNPQWVVEQELEGAPLIARAFETEVPWFPYILSVAVVLFAYSTMISWSYYGERCWERLFGPRSTMVYKVIFVVAVFCGAIFHLGKVLAFSTIMILAMAFPNILGLLLLSPKVRRDLLNYWKRYKAGQFPTFR